MIENIQSAEYISYNTISGSLANLFNYALANVLGVPLPLLFDHIREHLFAGIRLLKLLMKHLITLNAKFHIHATVIY